MAWHEGDAGPASPLSTPRGRGFARLGRAAYQPIGFVRCSLYAKKQAFFRGRPGLRRQGKERNVK